MSQHRTESLGDPVVCRSKLVRMLKTLLGARLMLFARGQTVESE